MISISWNENKVNSLNKKLDNIISKIGESARQGVENALKSTQQLALSKIKGRNDTTMIPYDLQSGNGVAFGILKTNFDYALFLEYGTGIYAELDHIGTTKTFIQSGYRYWYLPVDKADRVFDEVVIFGNQKYYKMYAQYPKPFMRPAGFENRDNNIDLVEKEVSKMIRRTI